VQVVTDYPNILVPSLKVTTLLAIYPCRWRHYDNSKHRYNPTQQHGITSYERIKTTARQQRDIQLLNEFNEHEFVLNNVENFSSYRETKTLLAWKKV
jgi:hypothetical protein